MNFTRITLGALGTVALTVALTGSAFAAKPDSPVRQVGSQNMATLSSGDRIVVKRVDKTLCHTLVKKPGNIARHFETKVKFVYTDGEFCLGSWYAREVPSLVFPYRSAVMGAPGFTKRWSFGELFNAANEALIIWVNQPAGWIQVGPPPVLSPMATLEEISVYLTGFPWDVACLDDRKDPKTGGRIVKWDKECGDVTFVSPQGWFVNDETTPSLLPLRGAGSLVTSTKFIMVWDRLPYNRALEHVIMDPKADKDVPARIIKMAKQTLAD